MKLLLKKQVGRCKWCGLEFMDNDVKEVDHIVPLTHGGGDVVENLQILHRHCHDQKTAQDNVKYGSNRVHKYS
jgi:RNA-directed DNA polymerase